MASSLLSYAYTLECRHVFVYCHCRFVVERVGIKVVLAATERDDEEHWRCAASGCILSCDRRVLSVDA